MANLVETTKKFVEHCFQAKFDEDAVFELFSENCLHQTIIGKSIGPESFITDGYDWMHAFPDFKTTIFNIATYRNLVVCRTEASGTHLQPYKPSNPDPSSVLTTTPFLSAVESSSPMGAKYLQPGKLILAFEGEKISQIILEEDPSNLCRQIGLEVENNAFAQHTPKENLAINSKALNDFLNTDLCKRELECLALALCGFSAKHAAELLEISYRTVETHLQNSYQKLSCYGKQQALEMMHENKTLTLWWDLTKTLLEL